MRRVLLRLLAVLAMVFVAGGASAAPQGEIIVVLSRDDDAYREVAQAMLTELDRQNRPNLPIRVLSLQELPSQYEQMLARAPALWVSVGSQAASDLANRRPAAPILHTLIPRQVWEALPRPAHSRDSALFLDQPLSRELQLVRIALPGRTRIGAITGPTTRKLGDELRAAARRLRLQIQIETIDRPEALLPALNLIVEESQVLISVADPLVFAPSTIHHILLTTYRHRVPVLGLSRTYVDAGALMAVHSTPDDIGRQLGEIIGRLPAGRVVLPAPQHPKYYSVSVNPRVASSLGLTLEEEPVLLRKLQATERPL
jgi:ABC-type uncharacterized transport system substrate-binding protein